MVEVDSEGILAVISLPFTSGTTYVTSQLIDFDSVILYDYRIEWDHVNIRP